MAVKISEEALVSSSKERYILALSVSTFFSTALKKAPLEVIKQLSNNKRPPTNVGTPYISALKGRVLRRDLIKVWGGGKEMKAGKLFEAALKSADIYLKPGTEFKVRVKGKGKHLQLIVASPQLTEFEASILERAKTAPEGKAPYQPELSVGETIRALRKAAGLTLEALASKAGMSKGSLCSIEQGERPAGLSVLKKLANALNVSIGAFTR